MEYLLVLLLSSYCSNLLLKQNIHGNVNRNAQKDKFSIKYFLSKSEQIHSFLENLWETSFLCSAGTSKRDIYWTKKW